MQQYTLDDRLAIKAAPSTTTARGTQSSRACRGRTCPSLSLARAHTAILVRLCVFLGCLCCAWAFGGNSALWMGGRGGKGKGKGKTLRGDSAQGSRGDVDYTVKVSRDFGNTLRQHLAANTEEHARDCAAGLLAWPTISHPTDHPAVTTTAHGVKTDSLISPGNAPFFSRDLVHVTDTALLSADMCKTIIDEAEEYARQNGWQVLLTPLRVLPSGRGG